MQQEDIIKPQRKLRMVIAYNGANYHGWQRQADGIDTVQQRVEEATKHVLRHPLNVHGASRTDAGVHAEGQSAHVITTNMSVPLFGMKRAMNSHLPRDIVVRSIAEVPMNFNASVSAAGKTYRYRIHVGPTRPVERTALVLHYWRPLDIEPMQLASNRLVGTHDFAGFASAGDQRDSTVRTITRCDVVPVGDEIQVFVAGTGFLYNQVRNIVGTLIEIGRGLWNPDRVDKILQSGDRRDAGPTSPPDGLTLMRVHYDPKDLIVTDK